MILAKVHQAYRNVVAVCDSDLLGKKFEEGKRQLEIKDYFFKGPELTYEEAVKLMRDQAKEDSTFNIVGKESVKAALDAGIISKDGIATIQNVPFALVLG